MRRAIIFFVNTVVVPELCARKQVTHMKQIWAAYMNQLRFSDRWASWADLHLRLRECFLADVSTTTASDNTQFGYMHLCRQLAAGNRYRSLQLPRVSYFHNLDLRKK